MYEEMDLRTTLATLRRQRRLIVALTIVAATLAGGVSVLQSAVYSASTTLLYTPTPVLSSASSPTQDQTRVIATLAVIPTTAAVLDPSAKALGVTTQELARHVRVASDPSTNLIAVTTTGASASDAVRTADAVAAAFVAWRASAQQQFLTAQVRTLTDQLSTTPTSQQPDVRSQLAQATAALANAKGDLQVVQPAQLPASATSPKPLRDGVIGLFAGLVIGIAIALIRGRLDHRLGTVDEAERVYGLPLIGIVPFIAAAATGDRPAGLADFTSRTALADAYRTIRTNLALYRLDRGAPKVVLITSAVPGEGKSAAAANIALAFAAAGSDVLVVSADLRAPGLHEYFPEVKGRSLLAALSGSKSLATVAVSVPLEGSKGKVSLVADTSHFSDPAALFGSERFSALLVEAATRYDVVVLDAPPVIAAGDTIVAARHADAVLLVAALERGTRDSAVRTETALRAAGIVPLGLIVTGGPNTTLSGEGYGVGYGYGSATDSNNAPR